MLTKENFNESHIRMLQKQSKKDPALLERAVFAFGLLEAIRRVEMPFIFKGGTCLILLLKFPMRLSTDIDIIVAPDTDVTHIFLKHQRYFHLNNVRNRFVLVETALKRLSLRKSILYMYRGYVICGDIFMQRTILRKRQWDVLPKSCIWPHAC